MLTSAGRASGVKGYIDILWFLWGLNLVRHFIVLRHIDVLRHIPLWEVHVGRRGRRRGWAWYVDHIDKLAREV